MTQLSHMRNFNKKKKRISKINADTLFFIFSFGSLFSFLLFYLFPFFTFLLFYFFTFK